MPIYISLLRGINVGGNKIIKMEALRALYETLGFTDAKTLLQSGNVVFQSDLTNRHEIATSIEQGIETTFNCQSMLFIRTMTEWQAIVANHLFTEDALQDPSKLLVTFLMETPSKDALQGLMDSHDGPEVIRHQGRELYIYYPDGMGKSKLSNPVIERKLKILGTGRNWNTVMKLLRLAENFEAQ